MVIRIGGDMTTVPWDELVDYLAGFDYLCTRERVGANAYRVIKDLPLNREVATFEEVPGHPGLVRRIRGPMG